MAILACCTIAGSARAQSILPSGGHVVAGSATIGAPTGSTLLISQGSSRAVIDWSGFSVGQPNAVNFAQPSSSAAILNRVTGSTPSTVAGQINANGQVYLVNPNGIAITSTGAVNVGGGFVGSTLGITNRNFMAGNLDFSGKGASAPATNGGTISTAAGGFAALIGGTAANAGVMQVPLGKVALGSGEKATLDLNGDGFMQVAAPTGATTAQGQALVSNSGKIIAPGGTVEMKAATVATAIRDAVNMSGIVAANSVSGRSGDVVLTGGPGGAVAVSGQVDVSAPVSTGVAGGSVTVSGARVTLDSSARIDASGSTGGTILVGVTAPGGVGKAARTTIAAGAQLLATGNPASANSGGHIETSGDSVSIGVATIDAGKGGSWLLDPTDLTIDSVLAATISNALNGGSNVTEQTTAGGSGGTGNIYVDAAIAWSTSATLTLTAYNNILVNAPITLTGNGTLSLISNNGGTNNAATVTVGAPITVSAAGNLDFATPGNSSGPFFTMGSGSAQFTGGPGAGASLTINSTPFTLLYDMGNDPTGVQSMNGSAGNFALAQPLSASGPFTSPPVSSFSGTFNGLGNTISTLTINDSADAFVGLFGQLGPGGTIENFGLLEAAIASTVGVPNVGALVGENDGGTISNAYATGTVTAANAGSNSAVGGLVGQNSSGTITNSYASVAVGGADGANVGGLVGLNGPFGGPSSAVISNSYATGAVSGGNAGAWVGGLAGVNNPGATITDAYATGAVTVGTGSGAFNSMGATLAGGLVGQNFGSITNAYATGAASGGSGAFVGGLVGNTSGSGPNSPGTITNGFWDTTTTGASAGVGGGTDPTTAVTTAELADTTTLDALNGGATLWGNVDNQTTPYLLANPGPVYAGADTTPILYDLVFTPAELQAINNNLSSNFALANDIDLTGVTFTPIGPSGKGFTGTFNGLGNIVSNPTINSSTADAGVFAINGGTIENVGIVGGSVTGGAVPTGGLVGDNMGTITNAYATTAVASSYVSGGLAGENQGNITDAYATGSVSGSNNAGGLVGVNTGNITDAYATGSVNGPTAGGLVGFNASNITDAYATGSVSGNIVGGLVGFNQPGTITDAYAMGQVTGSSMAGGLVGENDGRLTDVYSTGAVGGGGALGGLVGSSGCCITDGYWDTETSGLQGSSGPATGLTTAALQAALPTFVNPGNWGIVQNKSFPYLCFQAAGCTLTPAVVSGTAYIDDGVTPAGAGVQVSLLVNGVGVAPSAAATGANGYYYFLLPAGSLPSGSDVLTYAAGQENAAALATAVTVGNATGTAIYGNTLHIITTDANYSTTQSDLRTAIGNNTTASNLVTGLPNLTIDATGNFLIDQGLDDGKGLVVLNTGGIVAETASGSILANTLAGSSVGGAQFTTSNNRVTNFGPFNDTAGGNIELIDSVSLDVGGALNTTGTVTLSTIAPLDPDLTISNNVAGGFVNLSANGNIIEEPGGSITSSLGLVATTAINGGGAITLDQPGNDVAGNVTLTSLNGAGSALDAGAITFSDTSSFTIAALNNSLPLQQGIATLGAVTATTSGDLAIASGAGVTGNAVALAAGGAFVNDAGSGAVTVSGGGRWLIYSADPSSDTFGNLNSNNTAIWDATFTGLPPANVTQTGDRYLFAFQPTLTVTTTSLSKTYGDDDTAQVANAYTITGVDPGVANVFLPDTAAAVYSGTPSVTSAGAAAIAGVAGSPYAITATTGSLVVIDGYNSTVQFVNTGELTVNPAQLAATIVNNPTKVYDGTTNATLGSVNYQLSGFVTGQGATVTQNTGTYANPNAGSGIPISASLTAGDFTADGGTLLSNYILPTSAAGTGTILPATLTAAIINNPTKVYDGTTNATLGAVNYQLSGFVAGQGASVAQTAGSYSSANAGNGIIVTASLSPGDFTAGNGTLLSNYVLPTSAFGTGTITPAQLTAIIAGNPTKIYDGTTSDTTLSPPSYQLSGFVAGQGATVTQNIGTFASANAGSGIAISASLAPGDFAPDNGTSLSNYILPTSAAGAGTILPATLIANLVNNPTKVYDATTTATLVSSNYQLNGFIAGQGASVTQTVGSYGSANAGSGIVVTASLGPGDFTADNGTLLSNYVLPTSAFGSGMITPAPLTATIVGNPAKVYDGTTNAALGALNYQLGGFVAGQGAAVTQNAGLYASPNAGSGIGVSASLGIGNFTADTGTLLSNYILPTGAAGSGTITPAPLTATIVNNPTKGYDGATNATLGAANYQLSGFVAGQGAGVTQTVGVYGNPNAGAGIPISTSLGTGNFAADNGTLLSNYILPTSAAGVGTITPAPLTATIVNNPTKVYDGTTTATFETVNYQLSGFVAGQGAAITQSTGFYASPNAGNGIGVSTSLGASNLAADKGTLLSNYILPTGAAGTGTITPATLTANLTGNVGKVYDGTTAANQISAANYSLSGIVGGDNVALNDPSSGTYATANAGTEILVSVSGLTLSGSAASNYLLASNAISAKIGTITPAPLTVAADNQSRQFGNANPPLTYSITAGTLFNGDTLSGSLVTAATAASGAGSYPITEGTLAASANYRITFIDGVLTVAPAPATTIVTQPSVTAVISALQQSQAATTQAASLVGQPTQVGPAAQPGEQNANSPQNLALAAVLRSQMSACPVSGGPPPALFVVLPSATGQTTGGVAVSTGATEATLDQAFAAAELRGGGLSMCRAAPSTIDAAFEDAIAARPMLPQHFRLYLASGGGSDQPFRDALADIAKRRAYEIEVIGYTDTLGTEADDRRTSLTEAGAIRDRLVASGINPRKIKVSGRGKLDLLIPTPDQVAEPRNRRIEIWVR